jgi:hypothetical protein
VERLKSKAEAAGGEAFSEELMQGAECREEAHLEEI